MPKVTNQVLVYNQNKKERNLKPDQSHIQPERAKKLKTKRIDI
jgi:hypothetical protein